MSHGDFEIDGLGPPPSPVAPAGPHAAGLAAAEGVVSPSPGWLRRGGAGAWHVFSGFWFLLRHPRLWPLAALPAVLTVACLIGGLLLGAFSIRWLEGTLLPAQGKLPLVVALVLTFAVWIAALGAGLVFGLAVAMLLSAPVLERLSRRVEQVVRLSVPEQTGGWKWELAQSFRAALYVLAAAPVMLLLGLVPLVGPLLGMVWGAHSLALQQTDVPLARRGLDFRGRRGWHRRFRPESLGFGLAGLALLVVPLANFLLVPALTVGGTLLVLELEEDLVPPDRSVTRAPPRAGAAAPRPAR